MLVRQIVRFGMVGGVGFIIDGGMLWLLLACGFNPYIARAFSFPVAIVATWALNRIWTFTTADRSRKLRQFNRYLTVQLIGATANFSVYTLVVHRFSGAGATILLGLLLGSFVGMFINFWGAREIAFRNES
ncbi:GtrA family protein [Yoonia maritima]|uniref:GtrA family protein n=1 Tax=Yoonia maritima TaxID=1435347 RepID=UPI000D0FAE29|nr:GtrA family protein [Yoonia maritima]